MIIVYIKPRQFFKNVDEFGNVFEIENEAVYIENGFTRLELEDTYKDCKYQDFNEDLTFSVEKYNARKNKENDDKLLSIKLKRLEELRKDIVQDIAGLYIEDIELRKEEYRTLLNEVRVLQCKSPREIKEM